MASSFLSVCLLFIAIYTADGWLSYSVSRCVFNSTELSDIEFIRSYYYNKLEFIRFSSSVGKFVGYTEFGVKNAENWNRDPAQLAQMRAQREAYCGPNVRVDYKHALNKSVQPYVRLHSVEPPVGEDPTMLICSVYNFYPKQIRVTWIRNGQEVPPGVTSTEELVDGDWYYQLHSHLEYTPRFGDKLFCVVEHASLKHPLVIQWDPSGADTDKNMIIVVTSELILGLVLFLSGLLIHCRRRTHNQSPTKLIQNQYIPGWVLGLNKCRSNSGKFYTLYD